MYTIRGPKGTTFHYHSDYSGPVLIIPSGGVHGQPRHAAPFSVIAAALRRYLTPCLAEQPAEGRDVGVTVRVADESLSRSPYMGDPVAVWIPADDLRDFVAQRVRDDRTRQLESMSETYLAGGGDLAANPRTAEILRAAEESWRQREAISRGLECIRRRPPYELGWSTLTVDGIPGAPDETLPAAEPARPRPWWRRISIPLA